MSEASRADERHPLRQLYFYLTEGCNLCCRHCWIGPKHLSAADRPTGLDVRLVRSIIDQAKPLGLRGVKLTGGEPLLHPGILDILEILRAGNLPVNVETNGTLCTPEFARALAGCSSPSVAVSLDAPDAETHDWMRGVRGAFASALKGIRNLVGAGLKPQIIMSVVRRNRDGMRALVRLAESLGAASVKFNLVQPSVRGERMHRAGETLPVPELVELGKWAESALAAEARVRIHFSHPPAFMPLSRMFAEDGPGCGMCGILSILGVLSDGSYALCGIGESVADLVFGHAGEDRLEAVWRTSPVLRELRAGLPGRLEGVCARCLMKHVCLGSCIAQNYYISGNLWSSNWFCEEAKARGVFPESRLIPESA